MKNTNKPKLSVRKMAAIVAVIAIGYVDVNDSLRQWNNTNRSK